MNILFRNKAVLLLCVFLWVSSVSNPANAAYPTGFVWNIGTDFDYPTVLPAQSTDTQGAVVWYYYGDGMIWDDSYWAARTPHLSPLMAVVNSGSGFTGYGLNASLDSAPFYCRIKKQSSPEGQVSMDGREYRTIGARWQSPFSGTVYVSGSVGVASQGSYRWAVDTFIDGTLTRDVASGVVSTSSGPGSFNLPELSVSTDDMICISFLETGSPPGDYGEHSVDMSISVGTELPPDVTLVSVDLQNVVEPVNRRVMGVCLHDPPFDEEVAALFEGVLDGTSARAWATNGYWPTEDFWMEFMPFAKQVGIDQVNSFNTKSQLSITASYNSESDNNLDHIQLPTVVAEEFIGWANNQSHTTAFPNGFDIKIWETWNEPYSSQNGSWPSADMARYLLDCSTAIRQVDPSVGIGVALSESWIAGHDAWNQDVLERIAAVDIDSLDYAFIHPYNVMGYWYTTIDRVSVAELTRIVTIRPVVQLVDQIGQGRWKVAASEWNIHGTYSPPYHITTDMAAAINLAGMYNVFWEEGVDTAQFFHLLNPGDYHFGMVKQSGGTITLYPTAEVFRLYGRYFRGDRINTDIDISTYTYSVSGQPSVEVPYMIAHTAYDADAERVVLILTNRSSSDTPINVGISNFIPSENRMTTIAVTASTLESVTPIVTTEETYPVLTVDPSFSVQVPPYSVMAILINGKAVPADCEQVMRWEYNLVSDLNGDCMIDFEDFAIFMSEWANN